MFRAMTGIAVVGVLVAFAGTASAREFNRGCGVVQRTTCNVPVARHAVHHAFYGAPLSRPLTRTACHVRRAPACRTTVTYRAPACNVRTCNLPSYAAATCAAPACAAPSCAAPTCNTFGPALRCLANTFGR